MIERIKLTFDEKTAINRPLYCLHIAYCIGDRLLYLQESLEFISSGFTLSQN